MDNACNLIHQANDALLKYFGGIGKISDVTEGKNREYLVSLLLTEIKDSRIALNHLGNHSSAGFPITEHEEFRYLKETLINHLDFILEALLQTLNGLLLELTLPLYPSLLLRSS